MIAVRGNGNSMVPLAPGLLTQLAVKDRGGGGGGGGGARAGTSVWWACKVHLH